ncbi:MAG TPA: hypothetical protein VHB50_19100, partial [Bryobacteraceae bacterium]|nr:hypothetical protein [Bryobacteraceae bacterium]
YKTCRTIEPGINTDPIDLGFLRAYRVYSSSRIDALKRVIQANQRNKGWLCLYTHDISPEPSPWGCTPEQFRAVVAFAAESDAQLISVRDAADSLEAAVAA